MFLLKAFFRRHPRLLFMSTLAMAVTAAAALLAQTEVSAILYKAF
jgi:hypothetical protein